jgi:1,4-dihydroxy-2-naphthoate octaprenyltransferase
VNNKMAVRSAIGSLYGVAILISIFAGGLVPVLIVGAVVAAIAYRFTAGGSAGGPGRQRNRNRNRDRS